MDKWIKKRSQSRSNIALPWGESVLLQNQAEVYDSSCTFMETFLRATNRELFKHVT